MKDEGVFLLDDRNIAYPPYPVFVAGEPVIFLSGNKTAEEAWTTAVRHGCEGREFRHVRLALGVASFTRRGHYFDIDNAGKLVLDQLCGDLESIWITLEESAGPGATLSECALPDVPEAAISFLVVNPPTRSERQFPPITEAKAIGQIGDVAEPLGIMLEFHRPAAIRDFGFTGPIKPLLDGLKPIYGTVGAHWADHRVRDLRIRRGLDDWAESAVRVSVWKL